MCGGGPTQPRQREEKYDKKAMRKQEKETKQFIQESNAQQQAMAAQLQAQTDTITQMTLQRQQELAAEEAAAAAEAAARQTTTYATTTTAEAPTTPLTTEATTPRRKRKDSLKITPGSTQNEAGAGLNLGV